MFALSVKVIEGSLSHARLLKKDLPQSEQTWVIRHD